MWGFLRKKWWGFVGIFDSRGGDFYPKSSGHTGLRFVLIILAHRVMKCLKHHGWQARNW